MAGGARAVLLALLCLLLTAEAHAEVAVTSQARTAHAEFLPYAPAPASPAAVCLVDTGVDLNPDTQGAVIARTAIDGGSGQDTSAGKHGTLMTMVMAAPRNGWGMVGAWPGVRVVSVRALDGGYYVQGINTCRDLAVRHNIKVILLAAGTPGGAPDSDPALADAVEATRARDISVVSAAGNQPGPLDHPANYPSVLSVGAADSGGRLCAFSASGVGLDLLAPGCELELAHPVSGSPGTAPGTSQAAAFVAASLAAMRAHRPDLNVDEAERLLRSSAAAAHEAPLVQLESAFRVAGLVGVVEQGFAGVPRTDAAVPPHAPSDPPRPGPATVLPSPGPPGVTGGPAELAAPRVQIRYGRRWVTIRVQNRPAGCFVLLRAERRVAFGEFGRWVTLRRRSDRLVLPAHRWRRFVVRFEQFDGRVSPVRTVRLPNSRREG